MLNKHLIAIFLITVNIILGFIAVNKIGHMLGWVLALYFYLVYAMEK